MAVRMHGVPFTGGASRDAVEEVLGAFGRPEGVGASVCPDRETPGRALHGTVHPHLEARDASPGAAAIHGLQD